MIGYVKRRRIRYQKQKRRKEKRARIIVAIAAENPNYVSHVPSDIVLWWSVCRI